MMNEQYQNLGNSSSGDPDRRTWSYPYQSGGLVGEGGWNNAVIEELERRLGMAAEKEELERLEFVMRQEAEQEEQKVSRKFRKVMEETK